MHDGHGMFEFGCWWIACCEGRPQCWAREALDGDCGYIVVVYIASTTIIREWGMTVGNVDMSVLLYISMMHHPHTTMIERTVGANGSYIRQLIRWIRGGR